MPVQEVEVTTHNDTCRKYKMLVCPPDKDEASKAIKMVHTLTTEDGRRLQVIEWHPHVTMDGAIRVTVEAFIEVPEAERCFG